MRSREAVSRSAYLRERYCHPASGDYRVHTGPGMGLYKPEGKRYCESCATYQPRTGKAVKGWKCQKCLTSKP